jgi:hypothetical protein
MGFAMLGIKTKHITTKKPPGRDNQWPPTNERLQCNEYKKRCKENEDCRIKSFKQDVEAHIVMIYYDSNSATISAAVVDRRVVP